MKFQFIANDDTSSFSLQARILINQLVRMGHEVRRVDLNSNSNDKIKVYDSFKPDVVVFWTLFYGYDKIFPFVEHIRSHGSPYVIIFEVSDTDRLSDRVVEYINSVSPDVVITPSRWSASGFHDVHSPIVVLPHALSPEIYNERELFHVTIPYMSQYKKVVFIYAQHSFERKGTDIAIPIVREVFNKRKDFGTIIKVLSLSQWLSRNSIFPHYILVGYYPARLYYSYMRISTHFFYPVRGGAFEIPILEALAFGLTVVIPEMGAWIDIPLSKDDVYWIRVIGLKRYWQNNEWHVGNFVEPDVEDARQKFELSLDSPLHPNKEEYRKMYSPERIASLFLDLIRR